MADRGVVEVMTRQLARDVARRTNGYFSPGEPGSHAEDYVLCPLCNEPVSLTARPYPRNLKAPSSREIREAIERHLLDQYDDSRCRCVREVRSGSEYR